jgi:hypothetical protein
MPGQIPNISQPIAEKNGQITRPWYLFLNLFSGQAGAGTLNPGQIAVGGAVPGTVTGGDLSGDVTTAGSTVTTLATVNSTVGTFGDSTHVGQFTVNGKGLITAASNVAIAGGTGLTLSSVTVTDAAMKASPTSAVTLVAAQGVGTRVVPVFVDWQMHLAAAYTNINADSYAQITYTNGHAWSNYVANDSTLGYTYLTGLIGAIQDASALFQPYALSEPIFQWGNLVYVYPTTSLESNLAVTFSIVNGGSGNLTGGSGSNTHRFNVLWTTVVS